jgi:hypothetical protein
MKISMAPLNIYTAMGALLFGFGSMTACAAPGNALDRIDFGNPTSEAVHNFEPNTGLANMPLQGAGQYGFTYRAPVGNGTSVAAGSQALIFTMACDPNRQNYLSVKLWGGDTPCNMVLNNNSWGMEGAGGPPVYPNRFYYYTVPIPISQTQGVTSVELTLYFPGLGQGVATRPIYSAFTHTAPCFVPAPTDVVGSAPTITGQATLSTLTSAAVVGTASNPGILLKNRQNIYQNTGTVSNPSDYYDQVLARQVLPGTYETGTTPVPPEVVGLDLFTALSNWAGKGYTDDQWRDQIATQKAGIGYSGFPEELLSMLTSSYLLQPFTDSNGSVVTGLDRNHNATALQQIVSAMDGCSYAQGIDGGFPAQGDPWIGVTTSARGSGEPWPGSTARQGTYWGGGPLEGPNTQTLGWALIQLLDDPAMPASGGASTPANFVDYLNQSYNPDLGVTGSGTFPIASGTMLRAYAYERMLYEHLSYSSWAMGTVASQQMFNGIDSYSTYVALEKLLALFPNATYSNYNTILNGSSRAQQVTGVIPTQTYGMVTGVNGLVNYNVTTSGLGEAYGALSCGFDGGGYGQYLAWLAPHIAQMGAWDPNASSSTASSFAVMANATINAFDQFLSSAGNATVTNGAVTSDTFTFGEETYITERDAKNPNTASGRSNFNPQFDASDPNGGINNAYALRSAYLCTQYGLTPEYKANNGDDGYGGSICFLRDLKAYESTLRSLINVNPSAMTPLPTEPGQPDFAWADTRAGTVAFVNHGERFYMNANYRTAWASVQNYAVVWANVVLDNVAAIHDTTSTIERAAQIYLPHDSTTVQADGNLSGSSLNSPYVVSYGNYLFVLNNGATAYNATLPAGYGQAEELISKNFYNLGSTVSVPAGQSAIFWLAASSSETTGSTAPTLMTAANAPSTVVNGTTVNLDVLGAANNNDAASDLTYTWSLASGPSQVTYSANGTNAAQNTTVTFPAAGTYTFAVVVTDPSNGLTTTSNVTVTVNQVLTGVGITPNVLTLLYGQTEGFAGVGYDQFGQPMQTPVSFTWSMVSGAGSINSVGFYTAPASGAGESDIVKVSTGSLSATATITIPTSSGSFPASVDVGAPSMAGSATYASGTYTVLGEGVDIWGASDQFHFVYQAMTGDGAITARVATQTDSNSWSKSGVMMRNTLAANDSFIDSFVTPGNGADSDWRWNPGYNAGIVGSLAGVTVPAWVRIARSGTNFSSYSSPDGVTWTQLGTTVSIPMNQTIYVGLIVCSHTTTVLNTSTFDNVSITQPTHSVLPYDLNIGGSSGTYSESGTVVTLTGQSGDIWNTSDSFHYAFENIVGNGSITARVVSMTNPNPTAKAGVMIRNTLSSSSVEVNNSLQPSYGVNFQGRTTSGSNSTAFGSIASLVPPYWVQLTRSSNKFTAQCAPDNSGTPGTYTQVGSSETISTAGKAMLWGLCVSSNNTGSLCTAVFDHITVTGTQDGAPTIATAASAGTVSSSGTVALSVLGTDGGGASNLTYTWNVLGEPPAPVSFSANGTNAAKNTTVTFTADGIYYFQATITNNASLTVSSSIVPVTVNLVPTAPSGLAANPGTDQVGLSWTPSTFATSYNVERATTSGGPYTTVASPTGASYTDTGLSSGTTYYYVVNALSSAGMSAASSQVSATPIPPPPGLSTGLTAVAISGQVGLVWDAAPGAVSYTIARSTTSGGPYTTITSGVIGTTYTDTGLTDGTTYYYVITAVNAGGVGYASAQISGVPGAQSQATDTPVMPPLALAVMALLLFLASARYLPKPQE